MKLNLFIENICSGKLDDRLKYLYGDKKTELEHQKQRYIQAIKAFSEDFPDRDDIYVFSAPGRSEIGGNHTDHQRGCALAAAVNLDVIAVVSFHDEKIIRVHSEGHSMIVADLSDLSVHENEKGRSVSFVRGIAANFAQRGVDISGFDAYTVSDVLSGSGLSSSAAFETLIATIIDIRYNNSSAGSIEIAKIGQYAENVYFSKGSGLLDQMVCSVGGFVFMDFRDTDDPYVEKYDFDFKKYGYDLCITDTKGSHSDLTDDYVAIPTEMKSVANEFKKSVLREVDEKEFYDSIYSLHNRCSDRALLRAMHFFDENTRAKEEFSALKNGDIDSFFSLFDKSASSSMNLLQNLYSNKKPLEQGIPLAIAVSKLVLGENAHVRVHGGGFAGTIQAIVPADKTADYKEKMDRLFGEGSCYVLRIRPVGGIEITF